MEWLILYAFLSPLIGFLYYMCFELLETYIPYKFRWAMLAGIFSPISFPLLVIGLFIYGFYLIATAIYKNWNTR